jgi:ribonuclease HI
MYEAYCDGASRKDGRGGWGYIIYHAGEKVASGCGGTHGTTNNRMELQGAIEVLQRLKKGTKATVYSDSQYVIRGITEYVDTWLRLNWRTTSCKPVKNADLWEELVLLDLDRRIDWQWVRGHNGTPGNEEADRLATLGVPAV